MESLHYKGEVAQKAIIEHDGKILLVRGPYDEKYDLPGGRLHQGEPPVVGLKREVMEELGAHIEVIRPIFAGVWGTSTSEPDNDKYFVAFACTLEDPSVTFVLQKEEIKEARWVNKEEITALPVYDICKSAIKAYFAM